LRSKKTNRVLYVKNINEKLKEDLMKERPGKNKARKKGNSESKSR